MDTVILNVIENSTDINTVNNMYYTNKNIQEIFKNYKQSISKNLLKNNGFIVSSSSCKYSVVIKHLFKPWKDMDCDEQFFHIFISTCIIDKTIVIFYNINTEKVIYNYIKFNFENKWNDMGREKKFVHLFIEACKNNDISMMNFIMDQKIDINIFDSLILKSCANIGNIEAFMYIIKRGAVAIEESFIISGINGHLDILTYIMETRVHKEKISVESIKYVWEKNILLDNLEIIKYLKKYVDDIVLGEFDWVNIIHKALLSKKIECVKYLQDVYRTHLQEYNLNAFTKTVVENKDIDNIKWLINLGVSWDTILINSIKYNWVYMVEYIFDNKTLSNNLKLKGFNEAILCNNVEIVKIIHKKIIDIEWPSGLVFEDPNPFITSCHGKYNVIREILLENVKDEETLLLGMRVLIQKGNPKYQNPFTLMLGLATNVETVDKDFLRKIYNKLPKTPCVLAKLYSDIINNDCGELMSILLEDNMNLTRAGIMSIIKNKENKKLLKTLNKHKLITIPKEF